VRAETAIYTAFDDYEQRDSACAEKELMWAVLQTAIEDMKGSGDTLRQARKYFLSSDDQHLYSFLNICTQLELCPYTIRTTLGVVRPRLAFGSRLDELLAA
jgi:hypothetical protein